MNWGLALVLGLLIGCLIGSVTVKLSVTRTQGPEDNDTDMAVPPKDPDDV